MGRAKPHRFRGFATFYCPTSRTGGQDIISRMANRIGLSLGVENGVIFLLFAIWCFHSIRDGQPFESPAADCTNEQRATTERLSKSPHVTERTRVRLSTSEGNALE